MEWYTYTAVILALIWGVAVIEAFRRTQRIPKLNPDAHDASISSWPPVRIVIPARNEARSIEKAIRSILNLDYPHYRVVVIDDRSTDETGEILDRLAREFPRLKVIHIKSLPPGWLGKTYALYIGTREAEEDWLLFTDADVIFHPRALKIAMAFALHRLLDHLALAPSLICRRFWLRTVFIAFAELFGIKFHPEAVSSRESKAYVGIGAFNLIRRTVYEKTGGYQALASCPVDDVWLGRRVKQHGFRQGYAFAPDVLSVEWYPNMKAMAVGLEKNALAAFECRLHHFIVYAILHFTLITAPFIGAMVSMPESLVTFAPSMVFQLALHTFVARRVLGFPVVSGILAPVGHLIFLTLLARGVLLTLMRGEIRWRDTSLPVEELRRFFKREKEDTRKMELVERPPVDDI